MKYAEIVITVTTCVMIMVEEINVKRQPLIKFKNNYSFSDSWFMYKHLVDLYLYHCYVLLLYFLRKLSHILGHCSGRENTCYFNGRRTTLGMNTLRRTTLSGQYLGGHTWKDSTWKDYTWEKNIQEDNTREVKTLEDNTREDNTREDINLEDNTWKVSTRKDNTWKLNTLKGITRKDNA
jgi:hypothetical protein